MLGHTKRVFTYLHIRSSHTAAVGAVATGMQPTHHYMYSTCLVHVPLPYNTNTTTYICLSQMYIHVLYKMLGALYTSTHVKVQELQVFCSYIQGIDSVIRCPTIG